MPTEAYPTSAARPKNSQLGGYGLKERFGIVLPDWKQGLAVCLGETTKCG
ncbi:MAG: sugar nucleotide-binding protein [Solirubrobacteraceae bacterium]